MTGGVGSGSATVGDATPPGGDRAVRPAPGPTDGAIPGRERAMTGGVGSGSATVGDATPPGGDRAVRPAPGPTDGERRTVSDADTRAFGLELGLRLAPGDCVALYGELGAGKTCLTQGIAAALGVREVVSSPTFVLLNVYRGRAAGGAPLRVHHVDLYRLTTPEELADIGGDDYLHDPDAVSVVEWADRLPGVLPAARWEVHVDYGDDAEERRIRWCRLPGGDGEGELE